MTDLHRDLVVFDGLLAVGRRVVIGNSYKIRHRSSVREDSQLLEGLQGVCGKLLMHATTLTTHPGELAANKEHYVPLSLDLLPFGSARTRFRSLSHPQAQPFLPCSPRQTTMQYLLIITPFLITSLKAQLAKLMISRLQQT